MRFYGFAIALHLVWGRLILEWKFNSLMGMNGWQLFPLNYEKGRFDYGARADPRAMTIVKRSQYTSQTFYLKSPLVNFSLGNRAYLVLNVSYGDWDLITQGLISPYIDVHTSHKEESIRVYFIPPIDFKDLQNKRYSGGQITHILLYAYLGLLSEKQIARFQVNPLGVEQSLNLYQGNILKIFSVSVVTRPKIGFLSGCFNYYDQFELEKKSKKTFHCPHSGMTEITISGYQFPNSERVSNVLINDKGCKITRQSIPMQTVLPRNDLTNISCLLPIEDDLLTTNVIVRIHDLRFPDMFDAQSYLSYSRRIVSPLIAVSETNSNSLRIAITRRGEWWEDSVSTGFIVAFKLKYKDFYQNQWFENELDDELMTLDDLLVAKRRSNLSSIRYVAFRNEQQEVLILPNLESNADYVLRVAQFVDHEKNATQSLDSYSRIEVPTSVLFGHFSNIIDIKTREHDVKISFDDCDIACRSRFQLNGVARISYQSIEECQNQVPYKCTDYSKGRLIMTPSKINQVSSVYHGTRFNHLHEGFLIKFSFRILNTSNECKVQHSNLCCSRGGHGLSLIISTVEEENPNKKSTIGGLGPELGVSGLKQSLTISFDTLYNDDKNDFESEFISVHITNLTNSITKKIGSDTFLIAKQSNIPLTNELITVNVKYLPTIEQKLLGHDSFDLLEPLRANLRDFTYRSNSLSVGTLSISIYREDEKLSEVDIEPFLSTLINFDAICNRSQGHCSHQLGFAAATGKQDFQTHEIQHFTVQELRKHCFASEDDTKCV